MVGSPEVVVVGSPEVVGEVDVADVPSVVADVVSGDVVASVVVVTAGNSISVTPGGGGAAGSPGATDGRVAAASRVPTLTLSSFHCWMRSVLVPTSSTLCTWVLTAASFCCA